MAFPAHWAPNALIFYTGSQFPVRYKDGAFVAFHGSWFRTPFAQEGFNVVFVPFQNGEPAENYEVFADGFAGARKHPRDAKHRPTGLAQGPNGSLYVTDDKGGRIWRITYAAPAANDSKVNK
jgi:glucose/arabinose dehydrogenase